MNKLTLYTQGGEKIARFGKAGVQKALMEPVAGTTEDKTENYAMVWCPEKDVYISRHGEGQRSCTFYVSWWNDPEEHDTLESKKFEFLKRTSAINLFIKKCKELYE